jgi:hypothetical protein
MTVSAFGILLNILVPACRSGYATGCAKVLAVAKGGHSLVQLVPYSAHTGTQDHWDASFNQPFYKLYQQFLKNEI